MERFVPPILAHLQATAAADPDVVVVDDGASARTASQLWLEAGGVAGALQAREPSATGPVPVLVGNDTPSVAAMFGVLLSGRAVVAIERSDPPERVAHLVGRVGARTAVVADGEAGDLLPEGTAAIVAAAVVPQAVAPPEVHATDLAAIVFTSGSTGRPKGVRFHHGGLARQVQSTIDTFQVIPGALPGVLPFSFIAGFSQLAMVAIGRRLELRSMVHVDPAELVRWFDDSSFPVIALAPSYARAAFARLDPDVTLEKVVAIACFGEGLDWADVAVLRRLAPNATILASYGASEAAGHGAQSTIAPGDPLEASGTVPLGVPKPGTEIALEPIEGADDAHEIVLYADVAAGYWGDPELEAARFGVTADGRRFWRTGDLGEVVDGQLYHRGRTDDMVKIGGRLVEPAEAERVLRAIRGVAQAAVLPHQVGGHTRLVAHVQVEDGVRPEDVRRPLLAQLPPALWPSMLVRHGHLPVNARGKVDRVALSGAELRPWRAKPWLAPKTPVEQQVLVAAGEVLGMEDPEALSADDDLLASGIDSLALVELIDVLDERGVRGLTIDDVVQGRTAREIAVRVERVADGRGVVVLNETGRRTPLWVVAPPATTAMRFAWLAEALGPDRPVVVFESPGLHDGRRPARSVEEAAEVHVRQLRRLRSTRFVGTENGPVVVVGYSLAGSLAHEVVGQLRDSGEVAHLVLLDAPAMAGGLRRRARRALGDVRRVAWRPPATTAEDLRTLDRDRGFFDAYDALRRTRRPLDLALRRPYGRALVAPGTSTRAPAPDHYVRHRGDGLDQALRYRIRRPVRPGLFVRAEGSTADRPWAAVGGPIEVVEVAASHAGMLRPPAVAELTVVLQAWERRTTGRVESTGG